MNIMGKMVAGFFFTGVSIAGVAAFFEARDNQFGYNLSAKTQQSYLAAQKAENFDLIETSKKAIDNLQKEGRVASVEDMKKVYGDSMTPLRLATNNTTLLSRPLISLENQIGEDRYYGINDDKSPNDLRKIKADETQKNVNKIKQIAEASNSERMRDFDRYNLDFAQELRRFVEKNPKRFYEGQSLNEVVKNFEYVDYLQVLEKVIFKNVAEKTKATEGTKEFAAAYAEVAEKYFMPAIWTANEISLMNKNFVLE